MDIDWQLIGIGVGIVITIVVSAIAATEKITRKITKLEGRINEIEKNPLLEAFRSSQVDHATRLLLKLEENIKTFEAQKIGTDKNVEEKK